MLQLHIVCLRPGGMNRGGTRHEGHKAHELDAFTPLQVMEMAVDPNLALIVGDQTATDEFIAAAKASVEKEAAVVEAARVKAAAAAKK